MAKKTACINVKLDPRIRYGLELLARKRRQNISEVVTWVIENTLEIESMDYPEVCEETGKTRWLEWHFATLLDDLWPMNQLERIVFLKQYLPELLSLDEEKALKTLKELEK